MPPSFAQELASANATRGDAPAAAPTETATPETAEQHFAMPEHGETHPEQQVDAQSSEEAPASADPATPPPQKDGKIRIGTEVFDSVDDAMAYAAEIQAAIVQKDAFEQGKQAASQVETPAETEPDFFAGLENEIFENPKEAMKKVYEKALRDAEKLVEQRDQKKEQAQKIEQQRQATWKTFYESNNDLSSATAQEVVKGILQRDWRELGPMSSDKALPILAERSRAFIRSLKETQLPASVLQSGKTVTTTSTSGSTATTAKKTSSALDFISQVNKHRKRTDTK